ncbi:isochorismatase family cysteine hydrolase [Rhodopseudomonas boonkerdii]|uniref:isochorismatase family cysteine hydrolase n=1 Tax=Rhodopseudomonas boonkerdii TaxID=475937 RepID=UPI001E477004|nr:isochorismatase family cysteine hydrolase [Rhodopseudomonas boonkerdii]
MAAVSMQKPENSVPIENAVHLCVDMQRLFAYGGVWETAWMERVLPTVVRLAELRPSRNIFTKFIPPEHPDDRQGRWRQYFERWRSVTTGVLPLAQLDLVAPLATMIPPGISLEKTRYSAFSGTPLYAFLMEKGIDTIILSGAETDVCVLSTALSAVDLGFRTIIVEDALCSSSDEGHDSLMQMYRTRYSEQIEVLQSAHIPDLWRDDH